ncbi:MAG TPA: hypothetical protein PLN25_07020 [Deltaproteobacteria bacterium]|nr:hypothetical protein [Deltaproteobacteria bacterium]HQB39788.1 hypothetical protein [Deltaproteobacteria bacterium]
MQSFLELIFVTFAMLGAFLLVFGLFFLLALALFPVEKELSKVVWSMQRKPKITIKPKGSFKDFSKKH